MRCILVLAIVAGCRPRPDPPVALGNERAVHAPQTSSMRVRADMRAHDGDLKHIGELLRAGRLAEARTLAYWLPPSPAARTLANAPSLEVALRASARIAGACGECHARWNVRAPFEREPVPPHDPTARHGWGARRLYDGVVGSSEPQWRAGLTVFAAEHHKDSERALAYWGDRAAVYAELLVGCARCHH